MKNRINLTIIFFITITFYLQSQNVGIGVSNPAFKLDVAGTFRIQNTSNTAGFWFDGATLPTRSFIGTYTEDLFGMYGIGGAGWGFLLNQNNNNIGIGAAPEFRLDIWGRVRIQQSSNYIAGLYFDGTTSPLRSHITIQSNDNLGIWASGAGAYGLVMDRVTGNIGIGSIAPTQKLDVNGTIRIRNNAPVKGSVLMSTDSDGNTQWANPIAFRSSGTPNNNTVLIPSGVWTKINYNQLPTYNEGNHYQSNTSDFLAPVDGIYEFQANASIANFNVGNRVYGIRFKLDRGGTISNINEYVDYGFSSNSGGTGTFYKSHPFSMQTMLLAGDKVSVEVYCISGNNASTTELFASESTFFSGHIIARI